MFILEKPLLNWREYRYVDRDIGGRAFKTCPYCEGKKEFRSGIFDDYDDTDQRVTCTLCGWKGSRTIRYRDYGCSTSFSQSFLIKFDTEKNNKIIEKESFNKFIVMKLENGKYRLFYKGKLHINKEMEELQDIEIEWEKGEVKFNFLRDLKEFKPITLSLEEANLLLKFLELLNYDLVDDYEMITKALKESWGKRT
jgi:hypothetical protein